MITRLIAGVVLGLMAPGIFVAGMRTVNAQEAKSTTIELGNGQITLQVPKDWKRGRPRSQMLQYEFSAPAEAKEDEPSARITIMRAGGSIDANIERWFGQFTQPDGKATKDVAEVEKFAVGEQTVHWVNIPGTFKESMGGGPFAPGRTVTREDYRMLGAIIVTESGEQHFFKITGPNDVVKELAEDFKKMLKDMKAK